MLRRGRRLPPYLIAVPLAALMLAAAPPAIADPGDPPPATTVSATPTPGPAEGAEGDDAPEDTGSAEEPAPGPVPSEIPDEEPAPDETAPDETAPDETAPDETAPDETAPDDTVPDETGPDGTAPGEPAPEPTVPDGTVQSPAEPAGAEPPAEEPLVTPPVVKPAAPAPRLDAKVTTPKRAYLKYSYRPGCPVKPVQLRKIAMNFWGFDGKVHRGELIVRASQVDEMKRVFRAMFQAKFPIHRMGGVERYKGSDIRSMAADNTSAFNCRHVTGNPTRLSQHSYGIAIDVNTVENPYVTSSRVYPAGSNRFLDRSPYRKGMILRGSVPARAFAREQWPWGARWSHPDYQHFSANGG